MQLWWLLLSLHVLAAAVLQDQEDEDEWTCAAVQTRPTDSLQHCRFLRDAGAPVNETTPLLCDVLGRGQNHPEVLKSTMYFHARYLFRQTPSQTTVVDDDADLLHVCVGYVDLVYEKLMLDHEWTNATFGNITNDGYYMLTALRNLRSEFAFDAQVPVAFLVVDRECWQNEDTRNESCLEDVRMLKEVKSLNMSVNPMYPDNFTEMLRHMFVDLLHGQGVELFVDINPEISTLTQNYVMYMLKGFGYQHLHIGGGHWDNLEDTMPFMPRLLTVQLPNNQFRTIAEGNFGRVLNLTSLDLSNNNLTSLPDDLRQLKKLRLLDLSGNTLLLRNIRTMVHVSLILQDLESLQWLSLSRVKMKALDVLGPILTDISPGRVKLMTLKVSSCGLKSLPSFRYQTGLLELDLSGNQLQNVAGAELHLLRNLTVLNLARNRISGPLKLDLGVDILPLLDLSGNTIKDPADVLVTKPVFFLDLSRNVVTNWTDPQALKGYTMVNLSLNVISGASDVMCRSLSVVDLVDLGGNVFNCDDCRMPVLQKWLRGNTTEVLNLGTDAPLTCSLPEVGVPIEEYPFDEEPCLKQPLSLWLVVGVPVASVVVLGMLGAAVMYKFRFEVTYLFKRSLWRRKTKDRGDVYSYDAFVSYSRSDRWWVVDKLCPNMELSADKYRLCLHERDFALGSLILDNIEESMKNSRFMIVVLSNNFLESQWRRMELEVMDRELFNLDNDSLILVELERLERRKVPRRLEVLLEWPREEEADDEELVWSRLRRAMGASLHSALVLSACPW